MFIRFRQSARRLQVSLIETRRVDGRVRHEHVAALGSIDAALSVADRVTFWAQLHPRLDRLSNRLDAEALAKVLGQVHGRIPMVTIDDIRSVQLENAAADERVWRGLAEMQAEQAEGNKRLAASAEGAAARANDAAQNASGRAAEARERVERLKRGEAVAGGLGKPVDFERVLRNAGWTTADISHARTVAKIDADKLADYLAEVFERTQRADRAISRSVARSFVRGQQESR